MILLTQYSRIYWSECIFIYSYDIVLCCFLLTGTSLLSTCQLNASLKTMVISQKVPHHWQSESNLQSQVLMNTSSWWTWHPCSIFPLWILVVWTIPNTLFLVYVSRTFHIYNKLHSHIWWRNCGACERQYYQLFWDLAMPWSPFCKLLWYYTECHNSVPVNILHFYYTQCW